MSSLYDVIILGAGPAGLSAGLCAAHLGLNVLLIERGQIGGHLVNMECVRDYPGFPEGINGADLGMKMYEQASNSGMKSSFGEVTALKVTNGECWVTAFAETYRARAIIICTGLSPIKLGIPNEEELLGKGVSYCAICDGPFFKNLKVAVVGSGDMAVEDAVYLSAIAQSVTLVFEWNQVQSSQILLKQLSERKNIIYLGESVVESLNGMENIITLKLRNTRNGEYSGLQTNGVFVSLGLTPNTQFVHGFLLLTETKHLVTDHLLRVKYPNVFAAGDVRSGSVQCTAAEVGDGAMAALMVHKYLLGQ